MRPDVAILHDQFRTLGGAERVACEMARTLDATIFAARVDEGVPPADVNVVEVFDGVAERAMHQHYLVQDAAQMLAWQHQEQIWDYDIVVLNKTNPAWYVPRDHQTVLGYLHSTPRSMYDQFDRRGGGLATVIQTAMRTLFAANRARPDSWATNSELVQRRASLYWDRQRNVQTIYPPVQTSSFSPTDAETGNYYLSVGRLSRNKRTADIVEAFQGTNRNLAVAGDGPERGRVEALARGHDNIRILGYLDEAEKRQRMSEARAMIMNAESEDFGMTPIEAMAAGTPVIGVAEGYTQYQIQDGKTGLVYSRGFLEEALDSFERHGVSWSDWEIAEHASQFSVDRFRSDIQQWVREQHEATEIEPEWATEPAEQEPDQLLADGGDDVSE